MHLPTHIMSGWCIGNLARLTARERVFCMTAASIADFDGISRLFGQEAYWNWHHVLGHNLFVALLASLTMAVFATHRIRTFLFCLLLAHVHLVLDYYGSGPGWPIHYGWPLFDWTVVNEDAWEFSSWQNRTAAGAFLLWVLGIAVVCGRTPVEALTPDLDRQAVAALRRAVRWRKHAAPESAVPAESVEKSR